MTVVWFGAATFVSGLMRAPWSNGTQPSGELLVASGGKDVFRAMVTRFAGYAFSITEGPQTQEILIAVRGGISAFVTQRNEFKRSNPHLRPGALLTVTNSSGQSLPILFAHLKSSPSPEGFGLRDAMFQKVKRLKKKINEQADGDSEMILVGDLNTMGLNITHSKKDLSGQEEIARVEKVLRTAGLRNLSKSHPFTYSEGSSSRYKPAALDHVFATDGLKFRAQCSGAEVLVGGWAMEQSLPIRLSPTPTICSVHPFS